MLHEALSRYLFEIEKSVSELNDAHVERYDEEILSINRINLRIRIRFQSGHLFELNEAVILDSDQLKHLNYRYHFQDHIGNLIFRYDDTPHFPGLSTFPDHKHLSNQVLDSEKPVVQEVIKECLSLMVT